MRSRAVIVLLPVLVWSASSLASAAEPTPAPLPVSSPIVVPTLPPPSGIDPRILRAAGGLIDNILRTQREHAANTARGPVTYFRRYDLQVLIGKDSYRNVRLHPGTIINPRGATIREGLRVDVAGLGRPDGSLDADTITILH